MQALRLLAFAGSAGSALAIAAGIAIAPGCSSASKPPPGALTSNPDSGTAGGGGILGNGDNFGGGQTCAVETQFVYVVTAANELYRFDPPSLAFSLVGPLSCPAPGASPYSMAVDRKGIAWVVFTDGNLFQVDTRNAACRATKFAPGQHGFTNFGMGFSANSNGHDDETLFVTQTDFAAPTPGLAKIDTTTLELQPIGDYDKLPRRRAEMTGTGDARLFGAFEGAPYVVAEIDKSTAAILSQAPQAPINTAVGGSNFAFAFWGGDFWLFQGPGGATDVFQYKPASSDGGAASATTTKVKSVTFEIVGAGVSTCAPVTAPK